MTININQLIDGPQEGFEERLEAFKKEHPQFFKENLELKQCERCEVYHNDPEHYCGGVALVHFKKEG